MSDKKYRPEYRRFQTDSEYENSTIQGLQSLVVCKFFNCIIGLPIALYQDPYSLKIGVLVTGFLSDYFNYFGYQGYKKR